MSSAPAPADGVDLRAWLRVLGRRWLLITATTVLVTAVSLGAALVETPTYRADVTIAIEPSSLSVTEQRGDLITDQEIETQLQVLRSQAVAARAAETLGLGLGPGALLGKVGVARVPDSRVVQVAAVDVDPQRAADVAQAFAEAYLEERREDALDRVLASATALQARTELVRQRLDEIEAATGGDTDALARERATLEDQLGQLTTQLTLLDATDSFVRGGGQVIRAASPPAAPVSPQPVRSGVLGLIAGLALGVALAFVRERFDDAVRTDADVTRALDGGPVLGHVPVLEESGDDAGIELLAHPDSVAAEAMRTLRTNVRFAVGRQSLRSLLVTSPGEGEGKSTVAVNLAIAAANAGQRVVLVDADLRRPAVHRQFRQPNGIGTSGVLTGEWTARDVLMDVGVPNLQVMTAGRRPPNPSELLSDGMVHLVAEVMEAADLLVVDGPPVLAVADSLEVSLVVEATMLVVAHGLTGRRALAEAGRRLAHVDARLVGAVINVSPPELDYYGYYYGPAIVQARGGHRGPVDRGDAEQPADNGPRVS